MHIIAVTACPSGVAHTYMAAQAIINAAEKAGHVVHVETQGSIGIENELTPLEIEEADVVILTNDIGIKNEERFKGIPKVRMKSGDIIAKAPALIRTLEKKLEK